MPKAIPNCDNPNSVQIVPNIENPPFQGVDLIRLKCELHNVYLSLPSHQAPNVSISSPLPSRSPPPVLLLGHKQKSLVATSTGFIRSGRDILAKVHLSGIKGLRDPMLGDGG